MTLTLAPATGERASLAEGPVWDARRERLLWVDILRAEVVVGALDRGAVRVAERHAFQDSVGAVAVADSGDLLVANHEFVVVLQADGTRRDGRRVLPSGGGRRLNDGSTDPAGRFVVGSLRLGGPSDRETLVRVEHDGTLTVLDDDLTLSNGLAWSPDGGLMYSVDTLRRTVFVRDYDVASGAVGPRRTHVVLEDGYPDGLALDVDGHLWLAVWGAGEVRRFDPTGRLVQTVTVPAPHTSCVAFAGPDLRTLVVTTATAELTEAQMRDHPGSGLLYTARVDVPGLPVPPWAGATLPTLESL